MIEIQPIGSEPRVLLYDSLDELFKATGQQVSHGYFDPKQNLIVATRESVAHEIGHFKDFKSGRMASWNKIKDQNKRISARIRNEIVAILFARTKTSRGSDFCDYEVEFLMWLEFTKEKILNKMKRKFSFYRLSLSEIQDIADFLSDPKNEWRPHLSQIFQSYLKSEMLDLVYSKN